MVAPKHFTVDENFPENIEGTISRLPNGTATGSDGIYYEMLTATSKETSSCLTGLCSACGRTAHTPMDWKTELLVPMLAFLSGGHTRSTAQSSRPFIEFCPDLIM